MIYIAAPLPRKKSSSSVIRSDPAARTTVLRHRTHPSALRLPTDLAPIS